MSTALPTVVFFNPNLFAPVHRIGFVRTDSTAVGYVGGRQTDTALDAFAWLAQRLRAQIVGMASMNTGYDPKDVLMNRSLRAAWGPDWFEYATVVERYRGAAAWLAKHGDRPAVILDRPESANDHAPAPRGSIVVSIPNGVELATAHCKRAAALVADRLARAA